VTWNVYSKPTIVSRSEANTIFADAVASSRIYDRLSKRQPVEQFPC